MTLYAFATMTGYADSPVAAVPYTIGSSTCGDGLISSTCECGGTSYASGYCCGANHQAGPCNVAPLQVATPTFSPVAGTVAQGTTVTVSSSTVGATIYVDQNNPPTTQGPTFTVGSAGTWYAQAKLSGSSDSAVATVAYTTGAEWIDSSFLIGVWGMPSTRLADWKARGINTAVVVGGGCGAACDVTNWNDTAESLGLKQVRPPLPNPSDDIGRTSLLAWAFSDEPNQNCSAGGYTAQQICSQFNGWKAIDPNRRTWTTYSGLDFPMGAGPNYSWNCNTSTLSNYTSAYPNGYFACTDWASGDAYPVDFSIWRSKPFSMSTMTAQLDFMRTYAPLKLMFNYIEASRVNQTSIGTSVTGAQLKSEIWLSIIHGARGIVYFPEVVASDVGFRWDGSGCTPSLNPAFSPGADDAQSSGDPNGVCAAMVAEHIVLKALTPVLVTAMNPLGASSSVSSPLESGWRIATNGDRYFFVANTQNTTVTNASITVTGTSSATASVYGESRSVNISGGVIADAFQPFEVHIYVAQ